MRREAAAKSGEGGSWRTTMRGDGWASTRGDTFAPRAGLLREIGDGAEQICRRLKPGCQNGSHLLETAPTGDVVFPMSDVCQVCPLRP